MSDPLSNKEQAILAEIFKRHRPEETEHLEVHLAWETLKEAYAAGRLVNADELRSLHASYHALALGAGICKPTLDGRCLACAERGFYDHGTRQT